MDFKLQQFKTDITVTALASIHYFEFTANYQTMQDYHNFCELIYVDNGKICVVSDSYVGELNKNEMIVHKPNEKHYLFCEEKIAPNIIIIGFECNSEHINLLSASPLYLSDGLQKLLIEIVKEGRGVFLPPYDVPNQKEMLKRAEFNFGADQLIKNTLESFLIKAIREKQNTATNKNAYLSSGETHKDILNYINENFRQKITLDELCFLFSTNKTTLCREFKESQNCTVIDYVNQLKIAETKRLLRESSITLTEISDQLNLSSVHYLTTLFKQYEKLTPSEYMRSLKSKFE